MEKAMELNKFVEQDPNAPLTRGQAYGMVAGIVKVFDDRMQEQGLVIMENTILMDELIGIIKDAGLFTAEEIQARLEKKREELRKQLGGERHEPKDNQSIK